MTQLESYGQLYSHFFLYDRVNFHGLLHFQGQQSLLNFQFDEHFRQ
jgi:hypothetical protein